jgi:hypothetical protein
VICINHNGGHIDGMPETSMKRSKRTAEYQAFSSEVQLRAFVLRLSPTSCKTQASAAEVPRQSFEWISIVQYVNHPTVLIFGGPGR